MNGRHSPYGNQGIPFDSIESQLRREILPESTDGEGTTDESPSPAILEVIKHKSVRAEIDTWKLR